MKKNLKAEEAVKVAAFAAEIRLSTGRVIVMVNKPGRPKRFVLNSDFDRDEYTTKDLVISAFVDSLISYFDIQGTQVPCYGDIKLPAKQRSLFDLSDGDTILTRYIVSMQNAKLIPSNLDKYVEDLLKFGIKAFDEE